MHGAVYQFNRWASDVLSIILFKNGIIERLSTLCRSFYTFFVFRLGDIMDSTTALILLAALMWLLQIIFGWLQISAFNRAFMQISQKGKIITGRNSGRFSPKSVIVLALDEQQKVVDSLQMKGLSIFARPQPLSSVIGLSVTQIQPEKIFPKDKKSQFALKIALSSVR